ncbi:MAG TPA: 50S ribosomal protein L1 [Chloroflexia bacterium]|nr:50S ribosomal protein L1 [Chloroflexia bacterium]
MTVKHGKNYQRVAALIDSGTMYEPTRAASLVKETSFVKFDPTIEIHMRLGIDPRHADQVVRGTAILPHGTGKKIRILVFAVGEAERLATEAGADFVGGDDLIKQIEGGWTEFDVAISTPDLMGKVGKLGKILGRRGLMPNPKSGTIANPQDLPRVIADVRRGKVEFRNDKTGLVHVGIGKGSFSDDQIRENMLALVDAIIRAKPTGAKGTYVRSITLTSTMGPGIPLDVPPTLAQATTGGH